MTVLVIAEQVEGAFRKVTFEALSAARILGDDIQALVLGSGVEGTAAELSKYGAAKILVADDAALLGQLLVVDVGVFGSLNLAAVVGEDGI